MHSEELPADEPADVVVGSIDQIENVLRALGCPAPPALDYPAELLPFLGRRLWLSTINANEGGAGR